MKIYVVYKISEDDSHNIEVAYGDEKEASAETNVANETHKREWVQKQVRFYFANEIVSPEVWLRRQYEYEHAYDFNHEGPYYYQETELFATIKL